MLLAIWLFLTAPLKSAFILAGEPVRFERDFTPRFSPAQVKGTTEATRLGLAKWARTEHGRRLIAYFNAAEYAIHVTEDPHEESVGRAPQPGIATFMSVHDHSRIKQFDVILNPAYFSLPKGMQPLINTPASPADMMAAAWAGEVLHVYFYAQGIKLPHHSRPDFQDEWTAVANELGMGLVTHAD